MCDVQREVNEYYNKKLANICKKQGFEIVKADIDLATEEEFKQIRMDWFGASDSSKLLDVNPFPKGTCEDLIYEKITNEVDESISKKASVRMGKDLEELIIRKCSEIFNMQMEDIKVIFKPTVMFGNPENHLSCNFDAVIILSDILALPLEIKAVTKYGRKYYDFNKSVAYQKDGEWQPIRDELTGKPEGDTIEDRAHSLGIPVYYYTQLQQQQLVLNSPIGFLGVIDVDNWDVHIFPVSPDVEVWSLLDTKARLSWARIETTRKIRQNKKDLGIKA